MTNERNIPFPAPVQNDSSWKRQEKVGGLFHLALLTLFSLACHSIFSSEIWAYPWLLTTGIVAVARIGSGIYWSQASRASARPMLFTDALSLSSALSWGALFFLTLFRFGMTFPTLLSTMITAGVASGAAASLYRRPRFAYIYLCILLIPGITAGILIGRTDGFSLALVTAAFLEFLWLQVNQSKQLDETRHQVELKLFENQEFLDHVVQNIPLALFCKDSKENFKFTMWNKAAEKIWGIPAAGILGTTDYDHFPKDQADFFRKKDEEVLASSTPIDIAEENADTATAGRRIVHTIKTSVLGKDRRPRYLLAISDDITERKQEQELLRTKEAQIAQSAKLSSLGEMAAGIAHEINNPLAIVQAKASLLEVCINKGTLDTQRVLTTSRQITEMTQRMAKIVRGLLNFAREGSKDPMALSSAQSIVAETLTFCQNRFAENDVELRVKLPEDKIILECRATEISQVGSKSPSPKMGRRLNFESPIAAPGFHPINPRKSSSLSSRPRKSAKAPALAFPSASD
jgi:PAS domain S-box-containing protein